MYSHILVGSNDIARSKKFYDALFTAIGGQPGAEMRPGRIAYTHNGARFVVTVPNDGKPATTARHSPSSCVRDSNGQMEHRSPPLTSCSGMRT